MPFTAFPCVFTAFRCLSLCVHCLRCLTCQTRQHIGTLAYLAPELFDDLAGGSPAYRPEPVDIWAMGVMLYVMVCGDYPFGTDDPSEPRSKLNTIRAIRAGQLCNPRLPLALVRTRGPSHRPDNSHSANRRRAK